MKGISLFVVPKFLVNEDGSLGSRNDAHCVCSIEHKLGIKASPTAVLQFGDTAAARDRHAGRRGKPRPGIHVHHDERGALSRWACRASAMSERARISRLWPMRATACRAAR
ncbi:hypothetical protein ACU4GH_34155 [Bradyrhizobium betae]